MGKEASQEKDASGGTFEACRASRRKIAAGKRFGAPRGRARNDFEIIVPAGTEGTYFITATVTIGEFEYVETIPITFVQM